jgi:hypothetical protein
MQGRCRLEPVSTVMWESPDNTWRTKSAAGLDELEPLA